MRKTKLMLCLALALCLGCGCVDNEAKDSVASDTTPPVTNNTPSATPEPDRPGDDPNRYIRPTSGGQYMSAAAAGIPNDNRLTLKSIGFGDDVIWDYKIEMPFSVFFFDKDGKLLSDQTIMTCPMSVDGVYVGRVDVKWVETSGQNVCTIHKDSLLADVFDKTVDTSQVIMIGKIGSKTFVTDGVNLDILAVDSEPHPDDLSDDELKAMASVFKAAIKQDRFNYICRLKVNVQPIEQ